MPVDWSNKEQEKKVFQEKGIIKSLNVAERSRKLKSSIYWLAKIIADLYKSSCSRKRQKQCGHECECAYTEEGNRARLEWMKVYWGRGEYIMIQSCFQRKLFMRRISTSILNYLGKSWNSHWKFVPCL